MSQQYELSRELIQLSAAASLHTWKRDGAVLNAAPLEEYFRLAAKNVGAGQTAVFDLNKWGFDLIPVFLIAKFTGSTGNITLTLNHQGADIKALTYTGTEANNGVALPKLLLASQDLKLKVASVEAASFIWVLAQQVKLLTEINPDSLS